MIWDDLVADLITRYSDKYEVVFVMMLIDEGVIEVAALPPISSEPFYTQIYKTAPKIWDDLWLAIYRDEGPLHIGDPIGTDS